jgi:hypothetical protein
VSGESAVGEVTVVSRPEDDPRIVRRDSLGGGLKELDLAWAVAAPVLAAPLAAEWVTAVMKAREAWTPAFHGEQFSLGRAFYTHDEEGKAAHYFAKCAESDALVEAHLPGMQAALRGHLSTAVGAPVRPRARWCGAGVHVFPAGGHVAVNGGVVHSDCEGLTEHHRRLQLPAVTLVVMLSVMERGGGLRLWGRRDLGVADAGASSTPRARMAYRAGEGVLMDSYRFHQIEPFADPWDRVSITLHAARSEGGVWESWF